MKQIPAFLTLAILLGAQEAPKPEQAKPAAEAKAAGEAKPAEEAKPPAPVVEQNFSGSIEFGYRFRSDVGGNPNVYRSVVDLGEGPKLFGVDLTIQDPSRRLFDRMDLFSTGWGGDPYNTARLDVRRSGVYRFTFDYRNLAYFSFLPSFANPRLQEGIFLSQRAFDTQRRMTDVYLELRPGKRIVPYLNYIRDWGSGAGVTTYVASSNEYPVASRLRDKTDRFAGGVRVEMNRFHVTLEQGGTTFKDDQSVFNTDRNSGNRSTPVGDQRLFLGPLQQAYGVRGDSIFSRVLVTAAPVSWADVHGAFLYSQPSSNVHYSENAGGLFALLPAQRFYAGLQAGLNGEAKQPHTSGALGLEVRPFKRLRVTESLTTDRFHTASTAVLSELLIFTGAANQTSSASAFDRLEYNYNRQELNVLYDLTSRLTLRGGHRYVWGDSRVRAPELAGGGLERGELREHVGLFGFTFRPVRRFLANVDYEASSADRSYFRISLYDYHRLKARARYQVTPSLLVAAAFSLLDNQNPERGVNYAYRSRDNSLSVQWNPAGAKRFSFLGEYSRATILSDINYLAPQTLTPERSLYRENAHIVSGLIDVNLPAVQGAAPKISVGGALFRSEGSRPTHYYQPTGRVHLPIYRHVQWFGEWRWYGYAEPFYLYEGFRTHLFQTGLRLTM